MHNIELSQLKFDQHHSGFGVSSPCPKLSWTFAQHDHTVQNWHQVSYEVEVTFETAQQSQAFFVESASSLCVPWPARPLRSAEAARVRVRCSGNYNKHGTEVYGESTAWSNWYTVETALLDAQDWTANWIAAPQQVSNEDGSLKPVRMTQSFKIPKLHDVIKARLYITARGCYEAQINGLKVGDECMSPGWQSYHHRLHYQVFDVRDLLTSPQCSIDVSIAAGWYASALAWGGGRRCLFGDELALLAQLVIYTRNGTMPLVYGTDETWDVLPCATISSEIYAGEVFEQAIWNDRQFSIGKARPAKPLQARLTCADAPPVRVTQILEPVNVFRSASNKVLVDFGQNLVGRLRLKHLQKPVGSKVVFAHAEVLEHDELGRRPLRRAAATDIVICDGRPLSDWTPRFTFHGFRYVEVTGWLSEREDCGDIKELMVAEVLHTDMRRTGRFSCSHPLINKLHENATWSMRGNFLSIPSDCPQRDERLGWTGDIQVFAPSANFLYDTSGMLANWLEDLAAEQLSAEHQGVPPFVVPDVITKSGEQDTIYWPAMPNAVWDDVAVLLPWAIYEASGDHTVLSKQYESMRTWLDRGIKRGSDGLWDPEICQLGDWLDPIAPPSEPGNGRTDGTLVADAYLVHVTKTMAKICDVLELAADKDRYAAEHEALLNAFRAKYVSPLGLIVGDTQTALALGIVFELFETQAQVLFAGARLARSVRAQQFRVATGFAGTPIILHALTKANRQQLAYRMLLEKQCPSWLYAVSMGATTIWERWDSMLPDGKINPGEMTSFNHYALGSVIDWMHKCIGGISPLSPGWKDFLVRPLPGGNLTDAKVSYISPYGQIICSWSLTNEIEFRLKLEVPPNTRAHVVLPDTIQHENGTDLTSGTWIGSGIYDFRCIIVKQDWPPVADMPPFWPQTQPSCA